MHKFLRAAGFSMYQKKNDIRALLRCLSKEAVSSKCIQIDRDTNLCEMKTEIAPGLGIAMYGELNEKMNWMWNTIFPIFPTILSHRRRNVPYSAMQKKKHMQVCWMNIKWEFH